MNPAGEVLPADETQVNVDIPGGSKRPKICAPKVALDGIE
jgi:hypothetical protein